MKALRIAATLGLVLIAVASPWSGTVGQSASPGNRAGATRLLLAQRSAAGAGVVIQHVSPAPGAREVPAGGLLAVQFDRPMVPLEAIGVPGRSLPLEISPRPAGSGRWLGTSLWTLSGASGLAGATAYMVRIHAGLRALDGSMLQHELAWSFQTARPGIVATLPVHGAQNVDPRTTISVTFNQAVDTGSALAAVSLDAAGPPDGHWIWQGTTMIFKPSRSWPLGAVVTLRVGTTLHAAGGGPLRPLVPATLSFQIARRLAVRGTTPARDATAVNPANGVTVNVSSPLDPNSADGAVTVRPRLDQRWVNVADDGLSLSLGGAFLPNTRYTVTIGPTLRGFYGGRLTTPYSFSFTTQPAQPSVSLYNLGPVATFDLYRQPTMYARVINVSRLSYALYRPSEAAFARMSAPDFDWSRVSAEGMATVRRWSIPIHAVPNKSVNIGQHLLDARGGPLPAGYYYLTVSNGDQASDHQLFLVTGTGLTLKVAQRQVLAWAIDLKSGLPVPDMPLRVIDARGRQVVAGRTGADGSFTANGLHLQGYDSLLDAPLLVVGRRPGGGSSGVGTQDVAAAALSWNSGISPWDYNLSFSSRQPAGRIYLYSERPIYRPGQQVYFRGIARTDDDGHYSPWSAGTSVRVRVDDALGHTIYLRYLRLTSAGTFDGHLIVGSSASLGDYTLSATVGADTNTTLFSVAEYRKPSFAIAVTPFLGNGQGASGTQSSFIQGDRVTVRARATYYFGAPLGHAAVAWSVLADDYFFSSPAHPQYEFTDFDVWSTPYQTSMGSLVTQGTGTTDATGAAAFSLHADTTGHPLSQQLTIEATMGDAGNQTVSQRTQVIVHKGGFYLGLHPANVVATSGTAQRVDLLAVHPDGSTPAGAVAVKMGIYQRSWYSVYMRDPSTGEFQWQTRPHDRLISRQTVHTDAAGMAAVQFTPAEGGEYRITADALDSRSDAIHSATYLWAGSDTYTSWGFANNDRLRLVADRTVYHSGDVAHVLVPAPLRDMLALVTVERGRVLSHYIKRLQGNSTVLDLPITTGDVPDIYLSVVLVKGTGKDALLPVWKMGYIHLAVDEMEKALSVTVTPDKLAAGPGQRVTFSVHTADYKGRPVAAELSLALVDAAVLALAQDQNGSILDAFYADRELGVSTAGTLAVFVDRLNLSEGLGAKGGSGGGGGPGGHPPTRQVFPDTAYWNPRVTTDAAGDATVSVVLPDSLTTWRMVARGVTASGLVGGGSADLVSSKSLLVNPAVPRFLTLGDRALLGGTVANNGGQPLRVRVTFSSDSLGSLAGGGATFAPRELTIPAGGQSLVTWPLQALHLGGAALELAVEAMDGSGRTDRVATSLPVVENSTSETVATAGTLSAGAGSAYETINLPTAREPGEGDLTISLQPSVAAGLGSAAAMLDSYPYSCVEQTTSRVVGEAVVAGLPHALTGIESGLTARLPDLIGASVQRLMTMQHADGGWGWWLDDSSDPYMSAYAIDGLITLRHLGTAVDAEILRRGLDYLHGQLASPPTDAKGSSDPNLLAYLAYVLARGGRADLDLANALIEQRVQLSASGAAYLALAVELGTGSTSDDRVLTLLATLEKAAQVDATGAHWDARPDGWRTLDSSVGATAIVLYALLALDPHSPLIANAARWLLAARQGPGWQTTQQTALALRALTYLASSSGELQGQYHYALAVGGKTVTSGSVTPGSLAQQRTVSLKLAAVPPQAVVHFVLTANGHSAAQGRLYYTVRLRYYRPVDRLAPLTQGAAVTRTYTPVSGIAALGSGKPWAAGSTVRVTLSVVAPQDLYYVMLEDPLPAGTEGLDTSLRTTSATVSAATRAGIPAGTGDLAWYLTHSEVHDDRVALFANYLPAGSYQYTYLAHLTTAGTYHALPAHVSQMYFPDVFGRSAGGFVTVGR